MKTQLKVLTTTLFTVLVVSLSAQTHTVGGTWDMSASTPHGILKIELELKQNESLVSGTILNFRNQKQPVSGDFKDGKLTLQTTDGDEMALSATMKADGTLVGQLSMAQGDITWTATRAKKS